MSDVYKDDALVIVLPETLDAKNALEFETETDRLVEEKQAKTLVFDAENMIYISSAGLRIILKLMKRKINVSVINVSDYVYDIFDLTGYTNLMPIEKKSRQEESPEEAREETRDE